MHVSIHQAPPDRCVQPLRPCLMDIVLWFGSSRTYRIVEGLISDGVDVGEDEDDLRKQQQLWGDTAYT